MPGRSFTEVAAHEPGHTIQFILLSAIGNGHSRALANQWYPYGLLGGLGILAQPGRGGTGDLITLGRWWEASAPIIGR